VPHLCSWHFCKRGQSAAGAASCMGCMPKHKCPPAGTGKLHWACATQPLGATHTAAAATAMLPVLVMQIGERIASGAHQQACPGQCRPCVQSTPGPARRCSAPHRQPLRPGRRLPPLLRQQGATTGVGRCPPAAPVSPAADAAVGGIGQGQRTGWSWCVKVACTHVAARGCTAWQKYTQYLMIPNNMNSSVTLVRYFLPLGTRGGE
jgi:hypothetical protein